jgi:hypothetical protein
MNDRSENLIALIKGISASKRVLMSDQLYYDHCIAGDDAVEFLDSLANTFGVDMNGLEFSRYFPDETEAFFEYWAIRLGVKRKRSSLTVADILHIIEVGKWTDPGNETV